MANCFVLFVALAILATFSAEDIQRFPYLDVAMPRDYIYEPPNSKDFELKIRQTNFPDKTVEEMKRILKGLDEVDAGVLIQYYTFGKDWIAAETVARHYIQAVKRGDGTEYDDPKPVYPNPPVTADEVGDGFKTFFHVWEDKNLTKEQILEEVKRFYIPEVLEYIVMESLDGGKDPVVTIAEVRKYLGLPGQP